MPWKNTNHESNERDEFFDIRNKFFDVTQYTVLEYDGSGHSLLKSSEQDVDGEYVSQRRGSVYLCECFEVNHDFHVVVTMIAHVL